MKSIEKISIEDLKYIVENSKSMNDFFDNIAMVCSGETSRITKKFLLEKGISISHFNTHKKSYFKYTDERAFCENSSLNRKTLIKRILNQKIIPYKCQKCNQLPFWEDKKLVLVLDHINGINNDNRIENLRFLCPNCNSQTDTFSGKNRDHKFVIDVSLAMKKIEKKKTQKFEPVFKKELSKDHLIKLLLDLRSMEKVAKEVGMSPSSIRDRCLYYNIDFKHYCMLFPLHEEIKEDYKKTGNLKKTAKNFKTSTRNIKNILKYK